MKFMTLGIGILSTAMISSTTAVTPVHAATTMYLVDHYFGKKDFFPNQKIKYTGNGLISKIKETGQENTFAGYYRVTYTKSFTYKHDRIIKSIYKSSNSDQIDILSYRSSKLYKINYKNKTDNQAEKGTFTYTYKNGHINTRKEVVSSENSENNDTQTIKYKS